MRTIIVVEREEDGIPSLPGVEVVLAGDYLTGPRWIEERGVRVFNLCRSYRYQSEGYYVSLLAMARKHKPFPDLSTVLDMKSRSTIRSVDEDLDDVIQKSLEGIRSEKFELSVYFGRNMAARHERLARRIFALFPAPLLRAQFQRGERWRLSSIAPIPLKDVSASHRPFLQDVATEYFSKPRYSARGAKGARYGLAILHWDEEELSPSNSKALKKFAAAAKSLGFGVEMISRDDYGRLGEFDALFIRETTSVNHHTFRFAQRAEAEGLVVIDDAQSILRCTNKVFQTEVFRLRGVQTPKTWITDKLDSARAAEEVGFPCVLKVPDSAFSQGVVKCADAAEFEAKGKAIMKDSELLLVQEFCPSDYDWRVGVLDGQPLYVCRYHMAKGHWQIVNKQGKNDYDYGRIETLAVEEAPRKVVQLALRAANAIGDGLYGVDLKQFGKEVVVIEVNDNPNLDAGQEDRVLGDELYRRIMSVFLHRVMARKGGRWR